MERQDARTLSRETLEQMRKQTARMKKQGMKQKDIAKFLGVREATICKWLQLFKEGGTAALKVRKQGRPEGVGKSLTPEQETELKKLMMDKTPDQLKLAFALWTREAVRTVIKQQFGITMPIRTVGEYLKRWGFTPQKPLKRAYEQRPAEVQKWLESTYPAIAQRCKEEKAEIHWGDETGIQNDAHHERGYAPKGRTPVIRLVAKKSRVNMISTVTNKGKMRFMLYRDTFTTQVFIKFLNRLIKDAGRKVFLILDNLRVHHAKELGKWLKKNKKKIELFYLPAYSPELNPDEYLNCDLKGGVKSGIPARDQKALERKVLSHLRKIQKSPERVKKYFTHKSIRYAA
ncbi:MAG: IS630 family transposase [bacterium]